MFWEQPSFLEKSGEPLVLPVKARADARPPFGRLTALTGPRPRFVGLGMRSAHCADRSAWDASQADAASQVFPLASIALRRTINLRMQATSATFAGLPRFRSPA